MYNIAVIGGGVIGVTSAIQIQKDVPTAKVTIFAEKLSPNTTGDISAGLWMPFLLQQTPASDIMKWSKVTHDCLEKLWREGLAEKVGICLQTVLRLYAAENTAIPDWANVPYGFCMMSSKTVNTLSKQHGKKYRAASHFVTYTVEPTKMLPYLIQEFLSKGGNLVQKKVENFNELCDYDVIVNCAGLAARNLTLDKDIHAIRGQVCRVKAPWQFTIMSDESEDGNYIIPNTSDVVLGGTHQDDNENLSVNPDDKAFILDGCKQIVPGLKTITEYNDGVGLRPGRSKVRIEAEKIFSEGKTLSVVHNYGHGGAGVTLCFGCAIDASNLVKQTLGISQLRSHL
ncbi:D-amino acid oxidase 2 [Carabus blaptoides fortunei]